MYILSRSLNIEVVGLLNGAKKLNGAKTLPAACPACRLPPVACSARPEYIKSTSRNRTHRSAIASAEMKTEDDRNDSYRSAGAFTGSGDLGRGPGDSAGFGMNAKVNAQKELSRGND